MSSTTDKLKGLADQAIGNVKQGIGQVTGNDRLVAEGKAQELKGDAERAVGATKDGIASAADAIKRRL
ncbi:CsbD family protein [Methylobacterium sp. JK268]